MEPTRNLHTFHEFPENASRPVAASIGVVSAGDDRVSRGWS